jgi:hypothetical protein
MSDGLARLKRARFGKKCFGFISKIIIKKVKIEKNRTRRASEQKKAGDKLWFVWYVKAERVFSLWGGLGSSTHSAHSRCRRPTNRYMSVSPKKKPRLISTAPARCDGCKRSRGRAEFRIPITTGHLKQRPPVIDARTLPASVSVHTRRLARWAGLARTLPASVSSFP